MKKRQFYIVFNSPVVLGFALLSLLALLLNGLPGADVTRRYFSVYRSSLLDPLTYLRFFTHVLGHASFEHYINNILLLLVIGPGLEERYGSKRLLISILVTAVTTGLIHFVFFPNTMLLGASGIVFMMIVMSSFAGSKSGTIPLTLILVFALYVGKEVVSAITVSDSVSQLAHITGGVCGAICGFSFTDGKRKR